ncbi:filamentous hemagglutinin N-terminal domain-containing protein [Laspinema sp. D1]|uniref:filamentous hemagglutinin N-terminal domain-containing protein n=1 Tax=Laspinema palackyanum TaxID=3231601 RepID=UPI003486F1C7|nr:filamentous hemagglutinin N-terminal domain-containing protein [Laspinema sp. D2b]
MKQVLLFFGLAANLTLWGLATPLLTLGQIVPDQTLPVNSIVTPEGQTNMITGGTAVNGTLFHSFEQFSVLTGHSAIFNNEAQIRNILTRITGGTISEIDGLLRANGAANLFLLNPNGIVFGANARLDIGGSFFASTGSEFVFADGRTYSATTPNAPPLITVDVPLGVQFGPSPGAIVNRSQVAIPVDNQALPVGLQVSPGQSLILLGGEVVLEGGLLTAPGGQIAIASMGENAQVTLNPTPRGIVVGNDGGQRFQDIRLSGGAIASTSAAVGGDIQLQGRQVSVQDGSVISTASFGAGNAGNLTIAATESVEVIGNSSKLEFIENILLPAGGFDPAILRNGGLFALALGEGAAGNIVIETGEFRANNGAIVTTTTTGNGVGGNLLVNATNSVILNNAGLLTGTAGTQDAGNLEINTGTLNLVKDYKIQVN